MKLLVVESPNKVKKIKSILGEAWDVAATGGHIKDLPKERMGVEPPDYVPEYEYIPRRPIPGEKDKYFPGGEDRMNRIRALASKADMVYLATDPDREGEAISAHVNNSLQFPSSKVRRVTFDAITPEVIAKGIADAREIDDNLVHAQEARRVIDRRIGYRVSHILRTGTTAKLTAGRVQTPALRMVWERQQEIQNFKSIKHFGASVSFDGGVWSAEWVTAPHLSPGQEYVLDEALATRAASCRQFAVTDSETTTKTQAPPAPFTTSSLLQAAAARLKFKTKQTTDLAQKLFEQGAITYIRTDSPNLSDEALTAIREYAAAQNLPLPEKPRQWKAKQNAQEAHEAIRPTHIEVEEAGDTSEEKALYRLIRQRAIASQLALAEYSVTTLKLRAESEDESFTFRASGRVMTAPGWKALTQRDDTEEEEETSHEDDNGMVPALAVDTHITADGGKVLDKQTKAPKAPTAAWLIKEMERRGIGRPATYSPTVQGLMAHNYITEEKSTLVVTKLGEACICALLGKVSFAEYEYTKDMEEQLDRIAAGESTYLNTVRSVDTVLDGETPALTASLTPLPELAAAPQQPGIATCPACHKGQIVLNTKHGFWGCSAWRDGCKFSIPAVKYKKKLSDAAVRQLCEKKATSVIKGFKSKDDKPFDAKLTLKQNTEGPYPFDIIPVFEHKSQAEAR
jgi:DNA topoisomerase-1